jgi:hypothetical protein
MAENLVMQHGIDGVSVSTVGMWSTLPACLWDVMCMLSECFSGMQGVLW